MHRWLAGLVVLVTFVVASCGSGALEAADPPPSEPAKMICEKEAREDIAASLGVEPTRVSTPTWNEQVYSCQYVYADGVISLSVKELADAGATTGYFEQLAKDLGRRPEDIELGQGAFATTNGSVVVRKDFMVLDVDVSALPAQFGQPPQSNSDVALDGCRDSDGLLDLISEPGQVDSRAGCVSFV